MDYLKTFASRYARWRTTNATDNGYPSKVPTRTAPAESFGTNAAQATSAAVRVLVPGGFTRKGVVVPGSGEACVRSTLEMIFFGAGADTNTFSCRVLKWVAVYEGEPEAALWIPVPLFEVQVTLSTPPGLANAIVNGSQLFADTITLTGTTANDDIDISIRSPANNTIASLKCDLEGAQIIEAIFTTGGSATSCNGLLRMY